MRPGCARGRARVPVLPPSLRRILLIAPRGADRTFEWGFAWRNAALLGSLDRQRGAEQAIAAGAQAVGAVSTVMRCEVRDGGRQGGDADAIPISPPLQIGLQIAPGDALGGPVASRVVARAAWEALRRPEAENSRFSIGAGLANDWSDEFLKLVGPEIGRFPTATRVPSEWIREWARALTAPENAGVLASNFVVYDLPTAQARAAAPSVEAVAALPRGVRIHFLASGVEFVGEKEEARMPGEFDGAIDLLVEQARVRVVRAEMEPVWRRMVDGGRRQVAPLVKPTSEQRLLKMLKRDLADDYTADI